MCSKNAVMPRPADTPEKESFYHRPAAELMERLCGERIMTPADLLVISEARGFSGLIRSNMLEAHHSREGMWRPGDISVTNYRGNPQINVLGWDPEEGHPQYIWLKTMQRTTDPVSGDGAEEVKNPALVKRIAAELGDGTLSSLGSVYDYAMEKIHGQNVLDPKSPFRILPNVQHPYVQARSRVNLMEGNVDNAVGTASLTVSTVRINVDTQIRKIVELEAMRLKRDDESVTAAAERILNAQNLGWTLQKSPILKRLFTKLQTLRLV